MFRMFRRLVSNLHPMLLRSTRSVFINGSSRGCGLDSLMQRFLCEEERKTENQLFEVICSVGCCLKGSCMLEERRWIDDSCQRMKRHHGLRVPSVCTYLHRSTSSRTPYLQRYCWLEGRHRPSQYPLYTPYLSQHSIFILHHSIAWQTRIDPSSPSPPQPTSPPRIQSHGAHTGLGRDMHVCQVTRRRDLRLRDTRPSLDAGVGEFPIMSGGRVAARRNGRRGLRGGLTASPPCRRRSRVTVPLSSKSRRKEEGRRNEISSPHIASLSPVGLW